MATHAGAALGIILGMTNGLILRGPPRRYEECPSSNSFKPPMLQPKATPWRYGSPAMSSSPLSRIASAAARTANCENRSIRRAARWSGKHAGSKPLTSPAKRTEKRARVKLFNRADSAPTRTEGIPEARDGRGKWVHRSQSRDHHATPIRSFSGHRQPSRSLPLRPLFAADRSANVPVARSNGSSIAALPRADRTEANSPTRKAV